MNFFLSPWSFFHVINEIFAPPCSLITSCSLNRYYSMTGKTRYNALDYSISSHIFKHLHYHKRAVSFVFIYHHLNLAKICSKHLGLSSCHKVMTRIASFQTLFRRKLGYFFSILYDDQSYTGKTEQLLFFLAKNFSRQNTYILDNF